VLSNRISHKFETKGVLSNLTLPKPKRRTCILREARIGVLPRSFLQATERVYQTAHVVFVIYKTLPPLNLNRYAPLLPKRSDTGKKKKHYPVPDLATEQPPSRFHEIYPLRRPPSAAARSPAVQHASIPHPAASRPHPAASGPRLTRRWTRATAAGPSTSPPVRLSFVPGGKPPRRSSKSLADLLPERQDPLRGYSLLSLSPAVMCCVQVQAPMDFILNH
jgi:hypothetical protein